MIDAAAGIGEAVETADLYLVEAAAPRLCAKRAEKRVRGFQFLDGDDLGATAPPAQRDLVLVGGPPALRGRRPLEHRAGLAAPTTLPSHSRAERRLPASRISVPQHDKTL